MNAKKARYAAAGEGHPPDMEPEGMRYIPDFLSTGWQQRLLQILGDLGPWDRVVFRGHEAKRRKLAFGWNYDPGSREVRPAPPFPAWLSELRDFCAGRIEIPRERFVQASLTWYAPGAGIGEHRDAPIFGSEVVGVSLGAEARFIFRRGTERHELTLRPGSLLLLSGPARDLWTHEIPPLKATRYSIYFRSLRR
jgi:alkylated DNA repair dioxygenase AlkB